MDRLQGLFGIALILGIAFLVSNNRRRINYRLVVSGIALQVVIALLVFKVGPVGRFFQLLGHGIGKLEEFSRQGAAFVYGGIAVDQGGKIGNYFAGGFVFAFNVTATIVLVCALVAILYHFGIMQRVVAVIARAMNFIMRVSGAGGGSGHDPAVSSRHDQQRTPRVDERLARVHRGRHSGCLREHGRGGGHGPRAKAHHRVVDGGTGCARDFEDRFPGDAGEPDDGLGEARGEERVFQRDRRDLPRRG
jgi:hypothetical protein